MDFENKVVVITGASSGIGEASATKFAKMGANLVLVARRKEKLLEVEKKISKFAGTSLTCQCDVSDKNQVDQMGKKVLDQFGKIDILVNNAAIVIPKTSIEERTGEEWDRIFEVNTKGVFLGTKHALPVLRESGGGSIVNISSVAGIAQSMHQEPAYASSKAAVRIFTKVTAAQHAKDHIRCNSVHPGPIDTDMLMASMGSPENMANRLTRVPMERKGTAEEIAKGVLYLASDDSSYVTGSELVIDGGAIVM